jgi:hypothetical protein
MKLSKSQAANLRRILNIVSSGVPGVPNFELKEIYKKEVLVTFMCFDLIFLTDEISNELKDYGYYVINVVDECIIEL